MANYPDGAKYLWQAECKETMEGKIGYTSNLRKMFLTVLGCFYKNLRGKVRNRSDFDSLESSGDTLGLLNAIKQEGHGL